VKKAEAAGSPVRLDQGKPLNFGNNRDQGPRMRNGALEVAQPGQGVSETELLVHDEHAASCDAAFAVAQMCAPDWPLPLGVFRAVGEPAYEALGRQTEDEERIRRGRGDLARLLAGRESWTV